MATLSFIRRLATGGAGESQFTTTCLECGSDNTLTEVEVEPGYEHDLSLRIDTTCNSCHNIVTHLDTTIFV